MRTSKIILPEKVKIRLDYFLHSSQKKKILLDYTDLIYLAINQSNLIKKNFFKTFYIQDSLISEFNNGIFLLGYLSVITRYCLDLAEGNLSAFKRSLSQLAKLYPICIFGAVCMKRAFIGCHSLTNPDTQFLAL